MTPAVISPGDNPFISYSGTIGLVATVLFSINILLGLLLSTRYNPVQRWPHRRLPIFDVHNWTGYTALAVAFVHPTLLLFQSVVTFSVVDVLLPINSPQQPTVNTIGAFAIYALVVVVATSAFRTSIGLRTWKAIHYTSYAATPAFFIHGVFTNPNLDNQATDLLDGSKFLVYACIVIVTTAIFWRVRHGIRRAALRELAASAPTFMAQPTTWAGQLQLARIFQETPAVKTFRFVPTDRRDLPFTFKPGQFLTLSLPVGGQEVRRTYTVSSPPTRTGYIEITVKRETEGVASQYLHEQAREGDLIEVHALSGNFTFSGDESQGVVLIAGGVGITPMMSILRGLADTAWEHDVWMVVAVRTPQDIIYEKELTYLQERHPNFHLEVIVETAAGTSWSGRTGRITAGLLSEFIPDLPDHRIYLCGPGPMMEAVRSILEDLGVPPDRVLTELFSTPLDEIERDAAAALAQGACAAQARFRQSGRVVPVAATQTLLDAANEAGVKLDYSCLNGTCGTCRVKLLSGTVAMARNDALLGGDVADGLILACQARPTSPELLIDA